MSRRRLALVAFAVFDVLLVVVLAGLWIVRSNLAEQQVLSELGIARFEQASPVTDFQLTDQYGNQFTRADLLDKWQFVFFGFTSCPDICPLTMQALEGFYRDLEPVGLQADTGVIMVSVDPLRDTPEVMAEYLNSFHSDFTGLTGVYPQIENLASQLFIAFSQPGEHGVEHIGDDTIIPHSDYIALIDPEGRHQAIIHAPHRRERLMEAYLAVRNDR